MSLIGTCSDCGTGGVSLRYKPEVPINEQSRPSICDRCRDFREEQATHYVRCEECGDRLPSERAKSLDVTAEDEHYPKFIHFCPSCGPDETDDEPELATDGGTELGVLCDVNDCDSRIVGLDDGWEMSRGTVCQDCIDYHDRHGHWPDESVDICAECRIDDGMIPHECEESAADRVLIEPGTTCDYCGFEAAMTDGGRPAEDGQGNNHGQELTGDATTTNTCHTSGSMSKSGENSQRTGSVTTATEHSTRQATSTSTKTATTSATAAKSSSLIPDGGEEVGRGDKHGPNGFPYVDPSAFSIAGWASGDYKLTVASTDGRSLTVNLTPDQMEGLEEQIRYMRRKHEGVEDDE